MNRTPQQRQFAIRLILAGILASAIITGCSTLPTAPTQSADRSAGSYTTDGGDWYAPPVEETDAPQPTTASKTMNGLLGGTVKAGRFTAIVPPGAFLGTRTVTVTQSDPSKLQCELSLSGTKIQRFLSPIVLVADASDMQLKLLSVSYIAWLNPATGKWEQVLGSQVNLLGLSVSAPLWHFSTYSVQGKAGW
jgi:hypothetical protein